MKKRDIPLKERQKMWNKKRRDNPIHKEKEKLDAKIKYHENKNNPEFKKKKALKNKKYNDKIKDDPKVKQKKKEYQNKYKEENPGRVKENALKHYYKNRDKYILENKIKREINPKEYKIKDSFKMMKHHYGITEEEYNNVLQSQNCVCAICGGVETAKIKKRLSIDHCHETGQIRGILCARCNKALGSFKDSIKNLESAILYLKENGENIQDLISNKKVKIKKDVDIQ